MKREWKRPRSTVECFEANEYVASCWTVGCDGGCEEYQSYPESSWDSIGQGTTWTEEEYGSQCHNHTGSCMDEQNNRIEGHTIQELNSEQGWISGTIDSWQDTNGNGEIDAGERVFWCTYSQSGDRRWNHTGVAAANGNPNHS